MNLGKKIQSKFSKWPKHFVIKWKGRFIENSYANYMSMQHHSPTTQSFHFLWWSYCLQQMATPSPLELVRLSNKMSDCWTNFVQRKKMVSWSKSKSIFDFFKQNVNILNFYHFSVLTNFDLPSMNLHSLFWNLNHIWIYCSQSLTFQSQKLTFWLFTTLTISIIFKLLSMNLRSYILKFKSYLNIKPYL